MTLQPQPIFPGDYDPTMDITLDPKPDSMRKMYADFGFVNEQAKQQHGVVFMRMTSPHFPGVDIFNYKRDDRAEGHSVVGIQRDGYYEYYNSNANPYEHVPEPVRRYYPRKNVVSNPHRHQGEYPRCMSHATLRGVLCHLSNDEYNAVIKEAMDRYGLSSDGVVMGVMDNTIKLGPVVSAPKQRLKFGGIVYGRR